MAKKPDITTTTTDVFKLLKPLESADRKKVIRAVMTLLGDETGIADEKRKKVEDGAGDGEEITLNGKVKAWMSRNGLKADQLSHVFHMDGDGVDIMVDTVPGKNQKSQAIN